MADSKHMQGKYNKVRRDLGGVDKKAKKMADWLAEQAGCLVPGVITTEKETTAQK